MADNAVTLVGSLGGDPMLRSGTRGEWTTFRLATSSRWRDPQGKWVDGPTSWFDVSADGELGRHAAASPTKGQRVVVHGTITVKEASREDGAKDRFVQVRATALGPDLMFGTTVFTRSGSRSAAPAPVPPAPAPTADEDPQPEERGGDWGGPRQPVTAGAPQAAWPPLGVPDGDDVPF